MRLLWCICTLALAISSLWATEADPEPAGKPRELKVTKVPMGERAMKTSKITSLADFSKEFGKDAADEIAKEVNFASEYVVVFTWSGSGGDQMEMAVEGKKATFTRKFGRTRDLRSHFKAFVLPKDFTYEMGKGGR
ncbi:MAG: hypothetical protein SNJ82_10200 [Gemmataceae bacterium]